VAEAMLLHSIYEFMNQRLAKMKVDDSGAEKAQSSADEKEKVFRKMAEKIKIPAEEATLEAAAKAEGMRKIELEIAAAAGLLRPVGPEPQPELNASARNFDDLLRMVHELKTPPKSPNLDLFE